MLGVHFFAVTITPNGTTAYVANELGWVTPVTLAALVVDWAFAARRRSG